jgi:hypothetical protein
VLLVGVEPVLPQGLPQLEVVVEIHHEGVNGLQLLQQVQVYLVRTKGTFSVILSGYF